MKLPQAGPARSTVAQPALADPGVIAAITAGAGHRRIGRRRAAAAGICAVLAGAALLATPAAHAELKPGDPAPDFQIDATLGGKPFRFHLADALRQGPVVLYFYPKAFTRGCTLEANAFADAADDYAALQATVIGVSGDDIETLNRFSVDECRSRFAVGSDRGGRVMKSYDAAMPLIEGFAKRISYVISPEGRIAYAFASSGHEGHVPNTLAAVKRIAGEKRAAPASP